MLYPDHRIVLALGCPVRGVACDPKLDKHLRKEINVRA